MASASLPSLPGLRAFEAYARTGSMTRAATELNVSHGAVSRQVRALEARLGVCLVAGPRHQLHLTEAGARLARALSAAFELIVAGLPGAPAEQQLVVSCLGTLAMKWLIPRLPDFFATYPGVRVRIVESHAPVDFSEGGLHAAIRVHEGGSINGVRVEPFMGHFHGPVLAPEAWSRSRQDISCLLALPRLHSETFRPAWLNWARRVGIDLPPSSEDREFEHNSYMLEAAAAGLGVAVAPWAFAAADIASGRLVAPFGFEPVDAQFALLRPRLVDHPIVDGFAHWLKQQGRASALPLISPRFAGRLTSSMCH